ncbi:MAG: type II toxin-antitoxin system PemK/MazF family toxin [Hyphomicrobiales bacterium]|jgi:mRNA-degrading endonuclease toxin of MazEF toxin-antitoxin module|nr:type II toxin-antitoxin system PemK/MazF family toxin [Hyphomicrobiales bacterium]
MMAFEQWDVVTALFPFTDVDVRKPRPVVVLSGAAFNAEHGHVVAAMVTTGTRSRWPSDHGIADLGLAGLSHSSVVRWKIFTLPYAVIARRIGMLSQADRAVLDRRMSSVFPQRSSSPGAS